MPADIPALAHAFTARHGRPPTHIAEAPGRVNLIGEHTDYNDGFVLPVAIDRTTAVAVAPRDDNRIHVHAVDYDQADDFALNIARRHPMGGWRNYVRGVIWALLDNQVPLRGVDLSISGDIPAGAGLSSSAALELASAGALCAVAGVEVPARDLALLCQRAEHMYAGVQCGIMDQFASALGVAGHALFLDCRSLETEAIPLSDDLSIIVIDSRVPRDLGSTPYNQRRAECAEAAALLGIPSLRNATAAEIEKLPNKLQARARHVITENSRVLAVVDALRAGDTAGLGPLLAASHASLRDDFEVSSPEIDTLVELAVNAGAIAARLTGGGFGGCTVNLVATDQTDAFIEAVIPAYNQKTGLDAEAYICRAVDGMRVRNA